MFEKEVAIFREHGGMMRTGDVISTGVHPRKLYAMRDAGILEQISRGWYRLAEMPPLSNPDLVTVALNTPKGVICLISALAFHEITTQIPHEVHLAMPKESVAQTFRRKRRITERPIVGLISSYQLWVVDFPSPLFTRSSPKPHVI